MYGSVQKEEISFLEDYIRAHTGDQMYVETTLTPVLNEERQV